MELTSIHLLDLEVVRAYVETANGAGELPATLQGGWRDRLREAAIAGRARATAGEEAGANALTYGLGQVLAAMQPTFFHPGLSLTAWEARIDRGVGMLMRPPARLFIDAGLDVAAARAMPIRLDLSRGMMGGAFIPARLVPDFEGLLESRLDRSVRRLVDAELDPVAVMGLMFEIAAEARRTGLGLYEAIDVVMPDQPDAMLPGTRVVVADRKRIEPALRKRIAVAAKPVKKPGLLARMLGRGARSGNGLASYPEGEQR
ncbi:MAG: hypothetical protein QOF01_1085 [Thermomicrobiales bacterium]|nr:hypothetical protein [Thermomicrobiales bacterium]